MTPLFFIGAALGNQVGLVLGQDHELFAALGLVSVFSGAANTPIACIIMGIELFGGAKIACFVLSCTFAYLTSNFRKVGGLYTPPVDEWARTHPRTSFPVGLPR